jgi:hypothetical protein
MLIKQLKNIWSGMLKRKLKTRRFSKRLKLQGLTRRIEQALIVRRANLPYPPSMS